ncbi:endonuclease/exonuclease/phosphatase family protein [Micromonospora sp. WMMA1923]|uniref:endonuclease/exonuclease/phosphatase family protein n=1 Tax=Micromonospora sp. WMMA1923 TaxID=3404125 RepID=UPI003B952B3E
MSLLLDPVPGAVTTAPGTPGVPTDHPTGPTRSTGRARRPGRRTVGGGRGGRWPRRTRLLVGLAAAWAGFLAAFLLLTGGYWWWRPVELAPPLVFAAVPALLLLLAPLARPVRGRLAAVAVCLVVVGLDLAGLNPAALPGVGGATPAPPGAVRVFAWNTEYWSDGDDPQRFYDYLAAQRADVYLLSEYVGWDLAGHRPVRVDHLAELRRRFPDYQVVATGELLTMSRMPIRSTRLLDGWPYLTDPARHGVPANSDFDDYYRHKVLRTDLTVDGRVLSVYNVHVPVQLDISMDPTSAEFTEFMRAQQDRRQAHYRALRADLAANPHGRLIAGDFNATSAMGELRELAAQVTDAARASDTPYPVSWPDGDAPKWRLDWAFTDGPTRTHDYRMVPADGMSDHRGQLLTVSVGQDG